MNSIIEVHRAARKLDLLQKEYKFLREQYAKLSNRNASLDRFLSKFFKALDEATSLRNLELTIFLWMHKISFGYVPYETIEAHLAHKVCRSYLAKLYQASLGKACRNRAKALTILFRLYGIDLRMIARFLVVGTRTVKNYIRTFNNEGVETLLATSRKVVKKAEDPNYREALLSTLHCPPAEHGINRTTWTTKLLSRVMTAKGYRAGHNTVSKIIRNAGFRFRKAREVLTSNDPHYRDKLRMITRILSRLEPEDRFFSIDEFGPFSVKKTGGRRLVPQNEYPTIPQWQRSKGFLIVTAALELSTNQITHFYSKKKDSEETMKLLEILVEKYSGCRRIYFSWDAASWHASKIFLERVRTVNKYHYRKRRNTPMVKLAPLPARAQFLNVIESVFGGMATAIIHNSDYQSVEEAKAAIDRYFRERNEYFSKHPRRAGKKIWGEELVTTEFREGQNCKHARWR